jgi:hypothetical protein|tara:strand:- start:404 stop:745 length:342 start_codon:yes stop_codon:yes gene_type:complete
MGGILSLMPSMMASGASESWKIEDLPEEGPWHWGRPFGGASLPTSPTTAGSNQGFRQEVSILALELKQEHEPHHPDDGKKSTGFHAARQEPATQETLWHVQETVEAVGLKQSA